MTNFTIDPLEMVKLSREAYSDDAPDLYKVKGVEFLIREIGPNSWCVAFRGTTFNFLDIIRDLRAIPWKDARLGWCHKGFLTSARLAFPMVFDLLERRHAVNVAFTGHSLGAAQATLCAAWMTWEAMPRQIQLCTFGSPRVGRSLEGHLRGVKNRRYVNGVDTVTGVPSALIQRHVGFPIQLGVMDNPDARDGFTDHRIALYQTEMELLG